jgi:hypothetical protein
MNTNPPQSNPCNAATLELEPANELVPVGPVTR